MTIAIGFACEDGILMCADTKITGTIKMNESKLQQFVSDDQNLCLMFGITSDDINFPRSAIAKCWEYVKQMDFAQSTLEQVHRAVEFSLAEFYKEHIYEHPDRSLGAVYFELLVGIWLRGETNLYQSHETVLNPVDGGFSCLSAGGYLAKYLIRQYLRANPEVKTIDEMALIGSYAVQKAIDFDENCGGEVEISLVRKTGETDDSIPTFFYPSDRFIEHIQDEMWKMLHDISQMKKGLEFSTEHRIDQFCEQIKNENRSFKSWFDRFPSVFDR